MNERKKLTLQMIIFFLIIFVLYGTIIIKEKQNILFLPKIETSISNYISENYQSLELEKEQITEKHNTFSTKVKNPLNNNHYFYITYSNKKIKDTYQIDYLEGKTILNHLSKKLQKEIKETTNQTLKITFDNTLNNYSERVKSQILKENINTLKIYTIEKEITTTWNPTTIQTKITDIMTTLDNKNYTPKNYIITITNINDITQSVKINNLKNTLIKDNKLHTIINDIINNEKTSILTENKITYEYLN